METVQCKECERQIGLDEFVEGEIMKCPDCGCKTLIVDTGLNIKDLLDIGIFDEDGVNLLLDDEEDEED